MKKALLIGIDDYEQKPLRGCTNDATRLAAILEGGHCNYSVKSILNAQASRSAIRQQLVWLMEADTSLLFFAGHGWRRPTGTYLVTHDYEPHDEGIELQWLSNALKKLASPSNTLLFVIDACHSGDATARSGIADEKDDLTPDDLKPLSAPGVSRVLIAACKGQEVAFETHHEGIAHGAFSHHLCCALEGHASNDAQNVTLNAAFDYVAEKLSRQGRQTPVLRGDQEGQLILATGVPKIGLWKHITSARLTNEVATAKADMLLSAAQEATSITSFGDWQKRGYVAACQAFEPVLSWFRRHSTAQPELLKSQEFRRQYDSCIHLHKHLCALSPGLTMRAGSLGDSIGAGSFGNVWKMADTNPNSPALCFKSYHAHDILDAQKASRFRRGYEAMRQLDHPNIVKVLELSEVPFGFFMQYIQGANLRNLNPGASAEPEVIASLLLEVAETLQHAHGRGVIHRDVKPENIVVEISESNEYTAFLTDFDLAWFSAATQVTKVADGFGSHYYAAPEQINSPQANVAHKATVDIFAFGQLCFFCVCGRDPMAFDRDSNARALSEQLGRKWNDARASSAMLQLFKDCTVINPNKRVQDFREVCERLASLQIILHDQSGDLTTDRFLEQLSYLLTGKLSEGPSNGRTVAVRSRSNRTGISFHISKDASKVCAVEVFFNPNDLLIEGRKSADVRSLVNARIDAMLNEFKQDHGTIRKGAKSGAFEISVWIDHLEKSQAGVLKTREIISRVVDILELA